MNKQELCRAFSEIHAPECLVEELLQRKRKQINPRTLMLAACLAVIGLISAILMGMELTGHNERRPEDVPTVQIDWKMYAVWVDAEGNLVENPHGGEDVLEFTMECIIYENGEYAKQPRMEYWITFQEEFRYLVEMPTETKSVAFKPSIDGKTFYLDYGFHYVPEENDFIFGVWAMSLEKEWMIFDWDNEESGYQDEGAYLIAFRNPDTDPKAVTEFFKIFLDTFCFDAPGTRLWGDSEIVIDKVD